MSKRNRLIEHFCKHALAKLIIGFTGLAAVVGSGGWSIYQYNLHKTNPTPLSTSSDEPVQITHVSSNATGAKDATDRSPSHQEVAIRSQNIHDGGLIYVRSNNANLQNLSNNNIDNDN